MSKQHALTFFSAGRLFAQFVNETAHFAKAKKPVPAPHPDRKEGSWRTTITGKHYFVASDGQEFHNGGHPQNNTYRSVAVPVPSDVFQRLDIKPLRVTADYITLDRKHQDQFTGPEDAKRHVESVLKNPTHILPGDVEGHRLIVRRDSTDKAVALDVVFKGGAYRVQSAHVLTSGQLEAKLSKIPEGWKAEFYMPAGGSHTSGPMSHGEAPSSFWGGTVPLDTDSTGSSVIPCRSEVPSAGGSHASGPASETLRSGIAAFRRLLYLGGTVPLDTDSTDDTSIISLFARFSLEESARTKASFRGSAKPTRKAIEEARRQNCNASDSFCPDCGAVYEWANAEETGDGVGSCNHCGSHNEPVDGTEALRTLWGAAPLGGSMPHGKLALESNFFADFSTADFSDGTVTVPALLSRTGNYADKGIHLTAADFDRAAASVSPASPVRMNMAHLRRGSVLDDAGLGEIQRTWRRGDELWGEIAVPQWLASLARERGLKLPVSSKCLAACSRNVLLSKRSVVSSVMVSGSTSRAVWIASGALSITIRAGTVRNPTVP